MRSKLPKRILGCLFLAACALALPFGAGAEGETTILSPQTGAPVTVLSGAEWSADPLGAYYSGTQVEVRDEVGNGLTEVRIAGRTGYLQPEYLTREDAPALPVADVNNPDPTDGLNLRATPSLKAKALSKHFNDEAVQIMGVTGEWFHVITQDGSTGYMKAEFLLLRDDSLSTTPTATAAPPDVTPQRVAAQTPTPAPAENTAAASVQAISVPQGELRAATLFQSYAVVDAETEDDEIYMRIEPLARAQTVRALENGVTVELLEQAGAWYRVRVGYDTGYVQGKYLQRDQDLAELVKLFWGRAVAYPGGSAIEARTAPADTASVVFTIQPGEDMRILSKAGTWYWINIDGKGEGYVPSYLILPGSELTNTAQYGRYGVVALWEGAVELPLYAEPSAESETLGAAFSGTQVELLDPEATQGIDDWFQDDGAWYQVRIDGLEGYMAAKYIAPVQSGPPKTW